jgi:hypothetical protein
MILLVVALRRRNVEFTLNRFSQDENIRTYRFQGIADDRKTRTEFSVAVDLRLLHKHGIPLQEAPLLCSLLLASHAQDEQFLSLTFTEGDMVDRALQRAREQAEAKIKGKPPRSGVAVGAGLSLPSLVSEPVDRNKNNIGLGSSCQQS